MSERKLKERKFKVGVSDWEITFESGEVVLLNAVISEKVVMFADGKTEIWLENVTFESRFIKLFKKGAEIKEVKQKFELLGTDGQNKEHIEYNHVSLAIENLVIVSAIDEVTTVTIMLS